jgi:hypothetical protein
VLERGFVFLNSASGEFKNEFTYTLKDSRIEIDETSYYLDDEEWIGMEKSVMLFNETDLNNPIEVYDYTFLEGEWELAFKVIATVFDNEERPIRYFGENYDLLIDHEVAYNENGLRSSTKTYVAYAPEEPQVVEYLLDQEAEFTYNNDLKLIKEVFHLYEYDEIITSEYEYDEKGNLNYEITRSETDNYYSEHELFHTNFYSSGDNANDVSLSFQSSVYPNPASDVMNVTIEGAGNAIITLVNLNGSIVFQQKTSGSVTTISVQSLAKGLYFLTIQSGERTNIHKVIIR